MKKTCAALFLAALSLLFLSCGVQEDASRQQIQTKLAQLQTKPMQTVVLSASGNAVTLEPGGETAAFTRLLQDIKVGNRAAGKDLYPGDTMYTCKISFTNGDTFSFTLPVLTATENGREISGYYQPENADPLLAFLRAHLFD